jgi:hypothetical protein
LRLGQKIQKVLREKLSADQSRCFLIKASAYDEAEQPQVELWTWGLLAAVEFSELAGADAEAAPPFKLKANGARSFSAPAAPQRGHGGVAPILTTSENASPHPRHL